MKSTILFALALLGGALSLSACKNNDSGGAPVVTAMGMCQGGYVQTQYGCLPQGSCPVGQATYNNTCIPAITTGAYPYNQQMCQAGYVQTQYGCLPQGSCPVGQATYNNTCIPAVAGGLNPYGNQYLGGQYGQYPNGGLGYGSNPYGSVYNTYPYGMNGYYWTWYYGF